MKRNLDFISQLYNNRNSYADVFTEEELMEIHIESTVEEILKRYVENNKQVYLTGNPGDGKTHLIRSINSLLDEKKAYVELDANSINNFDEIIGKLQSSLNEKRPSVIAINEFPFMELLEELKDKLPGYKDICEQRTNGILYSQASGFDINNTVVIDLNNRNLLARQFVQKALARILELCNPCNSCIAHRECNSPNNIIKLSNTTVQERVLDIVEMVGNGGTHVVMRDIIGFIAYIITAGKKCISRKVEMPQSQFYDLFFSGSSQLFDAISYFDPFHYSHPVIDELLWNGELMDGWLFEVPKVSPNDCEDPDEALELFKSLKRKFYFENTRGSEINELLPDDQRRFYDTIRQSLDRDEEIKRQIISAINLFFNPDDNENDKLRIWTTHKYELRSYPKVAVANRNIYANQISLLIPTLPRHLQEMEYVRDHFIFRVDSSISKVQSYAELRVDLPLFKVLSLIQKGYPSQLVPDKYRFKLFRFMNELTSLDPSQRSSDFIIRDMDKQTSYIVRVSENQYIRRG